MDVEFGLQWGSQMGSLGKSNYVSQLKSRLRFAHNRAKQMAKRQQAKHKDLYDQRCRGAELEVGDLILVKQTAWKGRYKIQERWESEEYQAVGQLSPGVPVYTVKDIAGIRAKVLNRNLLLPLQGRVRQQGGIKGEDNSGSEDEEEGGDEMPKVARAPLERPRRGTKPKVSPSQHLESGTSISRLQSKQKDHSLLAVPLPPDSMSGNEDSSEEEMYTDSLTSHTTASGSTTADLLTSTASAVEDVSKPPSLTESQFSPDMPYLEGSTQPDLTQDNVFTQQPSDSVTQDASTSAPPEPPAPKRCARSTKGAPLCILESCTLIVPLFQMWLKHPSSDKPYMFLTLYLMIN